MTDIEALQSFVNDKSEHAFEILVSRYIEMVYSICLRVLNGKTHDAEDACQATFLLLAQKAAVIKSAKALPAWLHRTARFTALSTARNIQRRKQREIEAMQKKEKLSISPESEQESLDDKTLKNIDEAISCLNEKQQTAVIMHYLQGCSREEVAKKLDCSVDAIRKRLDCSLKKMHRFLLRRGTSCSCVALGMGLQNIAAPTIPSGLAASCQALGHTAFSTATGTAINQSIYLSAKGALKIMMWNKIKTVAAVAAVITTVATGASQLPEKTRPLIAAKKYSIASRPIDTVFTKDQNNLTNLLGKAKSAPPPNRKFLRELKPTVDTDTEIRYEYKLEPGMGEIKPEETAYTVEYLPNTSSSKKSEISIEQLAFGVSYLEDPTQKQKMKITKDKVYENFIKYYSANGMPWPSGLPVLKIDGHRVFFQPDYYPGTINTKTTFKNNKSNMYFPNKIKMYRNNPKAIMPLKVEFSNIISRYIYDAQTNRQIGGETKYGNWGILGYNFDLKLYHQTQLICIFDVSDNIKKPLNVIDIPIKKNAEADFGNSCVRVMSNMIEGNCYSHGYLPHNTVSHKQKTEEFYWHFQKGSILKNSKNINNNVIIGITPASLCNTFTFQFLDKNKKPLSGAKMIQKRLGLISFMPFTGRISKNNAEITMFPEAKYLRVRKYSKFKRFVVNFGFLPGTPKVNDNVNDLLDIVIPYVFLGNSKSARRTNALALVKDVAQTGGGISCNFSAPSPDLKREYRNITPRKLLQALYSTKDNPARIAKVDNNDGTIYIEKGEPAKAAKKVVSNKIPAITTLQPGVISRLEMRKRMLLASRKIQDKKYLQAAKILEELLAMKVIADPKAEFPLMPTKYRMEARFWIGQCYLHLGKKDKAQSIYQTMLKEDPKNKWAKFAADCEIKKILAPEIRKEEVEVF